MNLSSRVGVNRLGRKSGTPRTTACSPGTPRHQEEWSATGSDVAGSRTERSVETLPPTLAGAFIEVDENVIRHKALKGSRLSPPFQL